MCRRLLFVLLLTLSTLACPAQADIVLIVNNANPIRTLKPAQVADLYLGRTRVFSNGEFAVVFDHPRDSALRQHFFNAVAGMALNQVNAYWARLMFTGQVIPPAPLPDDQAVIDVVRRNPGAIGYVQSAPNDGSVRAVLVLN